MVGVAGKSKACHDCKRRRVKCDLSRPSCLRCRKAGLACQGYGKAVIFVNRTVPKPSTNALDAIAETHLSSPCSFFRSCSTLSQDFAQLQSSLYICPAHPTVFRSRALGILQSLYLPRCDQTEKVDLISISCFSWPHAICQLQSRSKVLDESLLAFCAVQVSLHETQTVSEDAAFQLYDKALSSLVEHLEFHEEQNKDETLAAIVVLSTCELFIFASDEGWRAHAHGISELLRHRPDTKDNSIVWQRLCSRLRLICIIIAISQGTRLALDPSIWIQFIVADETSKSFENLVDIVSEVPLLLENCASLQTSDLQRLKLFESLFTLFSKISSWQHSYEAQFPTPPRWNVPSRLQHPSDDNYAAKLFPLVLEYRSLEVATLIIFSSTIMLQILIAILRLKSFATRERAEDDVLATSTKTSNAQALVRLSCFAEIHEEADRLARLLCQTMEYCLRKEMGTLGVQVNCLSQSVLRNFYHQAGRERELDWVRNISNARGPGFRTGLKMMLFHHEQDEQRCRSNVEGAASSLQKDTSLEWGSLG